jgi:transcription-repair coupling factor (superfamily II helicase)
MIILDELRNSRAYQDLLAFLKTGRQNFCLSTPRSARLPLLLALGEDLSCPVLFLTDRTERASLLLDELNFWLQGKRSYYYPEPTPLFYERGGWGIATRRDRLETLTALIPYHVPYSNSEENPFIVAPVRAVMTRTLPRRDFIKYTRNYTAGQVLPIMDLIKSWQAIGYERSDSVTEAGQYSHRGGILDIWVPGTRQPDRLEFFGDHLDTIRTFDPSTQRTIEKKNSLIIGPAREVIPEKVLAAGLDETAIDEFHIPLAHPSPSSLLDYLPRQSIIAMDDLGILRQVADEVEEQAVALRQDSIRENLIDASYPVPYLTMTEIEDAISSFSNINLASSCEEQTAVPHLDFHPEDRFGGRLTPFIEHVTKVLRTGSSITIVSRQMDRIKELWKDRQQTVDLPPSEPKFIEGGLSEGWSLKVDDRTTIHLITDGEIFGWERPKSRQRHLPVSETPETAYADLRPGDWVVHMDHGIGQFIGMTQKVIEGVMGEYLTINYKGGDQLFVPIHQADRLTRYIGPDNQKPSPTGLSSAEWSLAKQRVREAVERIARELLDLYAKRQSSIGHAFGNDTTWQKELEASFPYSETEDQVKAIAAIKMDMENGRPMDRLLCGDVGYGKTEVALRAAFKAVMDGKQVAILVPTTVLAQQHYETFMQRLAAYPVQVAMLSRFISPHDQDETILKLIVGDVDIVIGTHRLLSQDVQFKDLGLVIIDEEQRFGVTHKEFLKKLRLEVDVLTLTATPIPRTLYMALTGVRDISTINTPPEERLPIVTHIGPYSPRLIRQAVLREMERGGQVFFVHNRVQTIPAMAAHLHSLLPEARVGIAHGQLPEHELSNVMQQFTHHHIDILLCTSIIESGLDIPNANTLIVDRADAFGLAQLYQLRGRVGRGSERAYAYFFRHKHRLPTQEGQERLEVIAEHTQLGAGYSIAMRDLEMRGAGELLGTRQHGYIASVGFHLYTRLLAAAVNQVKSSGGMVSSEILAQRLPSSVNVELPLSIGIPSDYIPDQNLRLRIYRRLADMQYVNEIDSIKEEFIDRFGNFPEEVTNLFYQIEVKLLAEQAGLSSISVEGKQFVFRFPPEPKDSPVQALPRLNSTIRAGKNAYWMLKNPDDGWKQALLDALRLMIDHQTGTRS